MWKAIKCAAKGSGGEEGLILFPLGPLRETREIFPSPRVGGINMRNNLFVLSATRALGFLGGCCPSYLSCSDCCF